MLMSQFSKNCTACNKKFTSLFEYMEHVKKDHKDIAPDELVKMGKEHKWQLKGSDI